MSQDGVLNLIARLHTHQELVAEAYRKREITVTDDNRRAVGLLQQHKVLVPRTQDTFTLHTGLRRFLDASLNIERLYQQGTEIGASFERLEKLADALFEAYHEGRSEDRDALEDELHQSIYEISDGLSADLAHLRALVENRFAAVTTLAEKRRQNAYYISRTEKVVKAIELFTLSDMGERIQSQPPYANVAPMFKLQIEERLPSFRQNLLDILSILQTYLFEFRCIEARTRWVRSVQLFLERHLAFELHDWDEDPCPPAWLHKASGVKVAVLPHVRDPIHTEELAAMARDIAPPALRIPVTREPGHLTETDEEVTVDLVPKRYQQVIESMLEICRATGRAVSADDWYRGHPELMEGIAPDLWIQCVHEVAYRPKLKKLGLSVTTQMRSNNVFDGNVVVSDVVVTVGP